MKIYAEKLDVLQRIINSDDGNLIKISGVATVRNIKDQNCSPGRFF